VLWIQFLATTEELWATCFIEQLESSIDWKYEFDHRGFTTIEFCPLKIWNFLLTIMASLLLESSAHWKYDRSCRPSWLHCYSVCFLHQTRKSWVWLWDLLSCEGREINNIWGSVSFVSSPGVGLGQLVCLREEKKKKKKKRCQWILSMKITS